VPSARGLEPTVVTGFPPSAREARAEVEEMLDRFRPGGPTDDENGPGH
jgi:hypothetical protein